MKPYSASPRTFLAKTGRLLIAAVLSLSILPAGVRAAPTAQTGPATLKIDWPAQVEVGGIFELRLRVEQAADIAGYETALLYDTQAAEYAGIEQRENDLKKLGRDISPLTAVDLSAGVSFGFFSCAIDDCVSGQGPRMPQGGQGTLHLATVYLVANEPGLLELKLDAVKFVDAAGNPVAVDIPESTFSILVGSAGEGPAYAAPGSMWSLQPAAPAAETPANGPFDLTGDGRVTYADAMEVAIEWETLRQRQTACGALDDATRDINHDGCLDVADMQLVAAQIGEGTPEASPQHIFLPLIVAGPGVSDTLPAMTWTVNSTGDQTDSNIGNGQCRTSGGTCTLRAAIQEANARTGPDTINFSIPGTGVHNILLNSKLPTLTGSGTTINGYSQPGSAVNTQPLADNAIIKVQIQGGGPNSFDGLVITSGSNTIRGLAFYNLKRPFWIYGSGATNNFVVGCFIGTNAAGTFVSPTLGQAAHGVHIEQGATNNRVGTPAVADRNVISGNGRHGVGLWHEGTDNNVVMNNLIGLNPAGNNKLPNRKHGTDLNFGASRNIYGGTGLRERNVISGNDDSGVEVSHTTGTSENRIVGNFIGTNLPGTRSFSYTNNLGRGILIEDGATANIISNNVIGTNGRGAIEIYDSHTFGNQLTNNRIGISLNGTPMPNNFGVYVKGSGLQIGPGNIIAYSTFMGIKIEGDGADFNKITQNSIFGNGTIGIDIWPRGVNQNDAYPHTGPNQTLNFPVLNTARPTLVTGTACAGCRVEIFVADSGAGAYGEGKTYVGAATANGSGSFSAAISGATAGQYVTSTATDTTGNTSEFSLNRVVTP